MKLLRHDRQRYNDIIRNAQESVDLMAYDAFDAAMVIYSAITGDNIGPGVIPSRDHVQALHHPQIEALMHLSHYSREVHNQLVAYWATTPEIKADPEDNFEYEVIHLKPQLRIETKDTIKEPEPLPQPNSTPLSKLLTKRKRDKVERLISARMGELIGQASLLAAESDYREQVWDAIANNTQFTITGPLLHASTDAQVQAILTLTARAQEVLLGIEAEV